MKKLIPVICQKDMIGALSLNEKYLYGKYLVFPFIHGNKIKEIKFKICYNENNIYLKVRNNYRFLIRKIEEFYDIEKLQNKNLNTNDIRMSFN